MWIDILGLSKQSYSQQQGINKAKDDLRRNGFDIIGEEITIYNLAPTISYRKNQVSINVKPENVDRLDGLTTSENIKDTGALIIQATSGKDNIYIISADNILKIKMTDGSIDGIIINCGTW